MIQNEVYAFIFSPTVSSRVKKRILEGYHPWLWIRQGYGFQKVIVGDRDYGETTRMIDEGFGVQKIVHNSRFIQVLEVKSHT